MQTTLSPVLNKCNAPEMEAMPLLKATAKVPECKEAQHNSNVARVGLFVREYSNPWP
jgi:hypothetical protein